MLSQKIYLLVCPECNRLCGCKTVGQESKEAKQQAEDIQTHEHNNLFKVNAKLNKLKPQVRN